MNILFFYRVYPNYGGVEVVTTVLANRFIKDGHGAVSYTHLTLPTICSV